MAVYTTIDDSGLYFNTKLYTGTGSSLANTGVGFQPDLTWIKGRSGATEHVLTDSVRGVTKELNSNDGSIEETVAQGLTAFGSDGFTVGTDGSYNTSSATYSSWNWLAGGSALNEVGSIDSTVSVNTTSGFSIVKYTGNGTSPSTVGHGLGTTPSMIILKALDTANGWKVYHKSLSTNNILFLHTTDAQGTDSNYQHSPNSSTFTITGGSSINVSGNRYIAYCFADVQGYSKFGSYVGSGSAPGTFSYLGFKPAFLLMKESDGADGWGLYDNKRNPSNTTSFLLQANSSGAESNAVANTIDFLSNGFKVCASGTQGNFINESGKTYIYMAFAEQPFVTSTGVPACAR